MKKLRKRGLIMAQAIVYTCDICKQSKGGQRTGAKTE